MAHRGERLRCPLDRLDLPVGEAYFGYAIHFDVLGIRHYVQGTCQYDIALVQMGWNGAPCGEYPLWQPSHKEFDRAVKTIPAFDRNHTRVGFSWAYGHPVVINDQSKVRFLRPGKEMIDVIPATEVVGVADLHFVFAVDRSGPLDPRVLVRRECDRSSGSLAKSDHAVVLGG